MHPLGWTFIRQELTAEVVNPYQERSGLRTEHVLQPGLMKELIVQRGLDLSRIHSANTAQSGRDASSPKRK